MTSAPSRRTSWADFLRGGALETGRERSREEEPPTVPPPGRTAAREARLIELAEALSDRRDGS